MPGLFASRQAMGQTSALQAQERSAMTLSEIQTIVGGALVGVPLAGPIDCLMVDPRLLSPPDTTLFVALHPVAPGNIDAAYTRGIRRFLVEEIPLHPLPDAALIHVPSVVQALEDLVAHRRLACAAPVVGVFGQQSVAIREWLYQMLSEDRLCIKTPPNYTDLPRVALAVWNIEARHEAGVFGAEAPDEPTACRIQRMMQPTLAVIACPSIEATPAALFNKAQALIYQHSDSAATQLATTCRLQATHISWGSSPEAAVCVERRRDAVVCQASPWGTFTLPLPVCNDHTADALLHCAIAMLHLGYTSQDVTERMHRLNLTPPRFTMMTGVSRCRIIVDTYVNDLEGIQASFDFLEQMGDRKKTCILADPTAYGADRLLFACLAQSIQTQRLDRWIGVGPRFFEHRDLFVHAAPEAHVYPHANALLQNVDSHRFADETILIRGVPNPWIGALEKVLRETAPASVMEVSLDAIAYNLNVFRSALPTRLKYMAMVKASAYGCGGVTVARLLQYHRIDYLGVANAGEGAAFRRNGVDTPIVVMNPTWEDFPLIQKYDLEPSLYTLQLLEHWARFSQNRPSKAHLKIDTGMHRLGIVLQEIHTVNAILDQHPHLAVASVFSHLAAADDPQHDTFSAGQIALLQRVAQGLKKTDPPPIIHALNSSGAIRMPQACGDMVRLGIALYGVDPTNTAPHRLRVAAALKTRVLQVKTVRTGETVGYGRKGVAQHPMRVAIIAIGYADGFLRAHGEGAGFVMIRDRRAPVVGKVSMDTAAVDVTEIDCAQAGDEVCIFGDTLPVQEAAARINTIAYEILTDVGPRVNRVFYARGL